MTNLLLRTVGATLLAALCVAASAGAQQGQPGANGGQRPLPAFAAVSSSGDVVTSDRFNAAERWLLVYIEPGTVVGDRLLRALDEWAGADASRIVVIAAGGPSVIDAKVRPLLANSSAAAVFADPDGSAARALGITSGAALVGVRNRAVDWLVEGVLNDPQMVEPVVRNWIVS